MTVLDDEARSLLDAAMVARIATVSSGGRPHVNPLYFVVDGDRIHLGTATVTLAARNVRANPEVQILFEVEADPEDRRLLRVDGTAVVSTEAGLLRRYRNRDARKYVLTGRGLWNLLAHVRQWRPMSRHLRGGDACVIDVTPTSAVMVRR
jgi:general stress protein 26